MEIMKWFLKTLIWNNKLNNRCRNIKQVVDRKKWLLAFIIEKWEEKYNE